MSQIKLLVRKVGDVTVVDPNERFIRDADQIGKLGDALYALIEKEGNQKIVLDLSKAQLFSSAALGVMMALKKKANEKGSRVVVSGLTKEIKEVFKIVGIDRMFEFYPDEAKALASFG